ncbi:hypothetical protein GGR50DRAFT_435607 [Xylaria sp. CBS 124048]|nr:hypothetical protein GGR50DRAFT_435607 [Xylaria sp. CBS 124048]
MGVTYRGLRQTTRLHQIVVVCVLCLAIYCFLFTPAEIQEEKPRPAPLSPDTLNNRFLTEDQCRAAFPGLLTEVDNEVAKGPFKLERNPYNLGPLIARIRDGQLYILLAGRKADLSQDMLAHRAATLHQIANALLTWPRPSESSSSSPFSHIPNTIIAFNHQDNPSASTFSYSRPADPAYSAGSPPKRFFPIPHFSHYAWPIPFIGSLSRAAAAITALESTLPFPSKIPRAIWRGTTWFNNPHAGRLRHNLVLAFRTAPWADIEPLTWSSTTASNGEKTASNAIPIEDFCRYKYIIYTEGVTYSGRLHFHNLCGSVVITPPLAWMQPLTHLLRPVFSYSLRPDAAPGPGLPRTPVLNKQKLDAYPADWVRSAWPAEYAADDANVVFVAPDWSDLEATIAWLEARPRVAEGIAARQRALFAEGGYLSPAAEACYWRALIRGWSEIVRVDEGAFDDLEEVPWEEFSLKEVHK